MASLPTTNCGPPAAVADAVKTPDRDGTRQVRAERMTADPGPDGEASAATAEVPAAMVVLPDKVNSDSAGEPAERVADRGVLRRRSASSNTPCVSTRMAMAS